MSLTIHRFIISWPFCCIWVPDSIKTEGKFQIHSISFWHQEMKKDHQAGILKNKDLTFDCIKNFHFHLKVSIAWQKFSLPVTYLFLCKLSYFCDCWGLSSLLLYKHISDQDFSQLALFDLPCRWHIWRSPCVEASHSAHYGVHMKHGYWLCCFMLKYILLTNF